MADAVNSDTADFRPYRMLKEYANGVMDQKGRFYPYRLYKTDATDDLIGKVNVQYYVKSVLLSATAVGAVAAGRAQVTAKVRGLNTILAKLITPAMTQATDYFGDSQNISVGVLCDPNADLDLANSVALFTMIICYAEVDYDPEYAT